MPKVNDKQLRDVLRKATDGDANSAPWSFGDKYCEYVRGSAEITIAEAFGGKERFDIARLIALAPDLAAEVLALRREVRRLRKVVGYGR